MTSASVLPMWRSPTNSSATTYSYSAPTRQGTWDEDESEAKWTSGEAAVGSPTRMIQCLNFLSQIEYVRVRETRKRFRDTVFVLDINLTPEPGKKPSRNQPTYQIERSLSEFDDLRHEIAYWVKQHSYSMHRSQPRKHPHQRRGSRDKTPHACAFCSALHTRCMAWEQRWPGRFLLSRLFLSRDKIEAPLQAMLRDVLQLLGSATGKAAPSLGCMAHAQLPSAVTNFFLRQELSMED